jgi:hypothetical protein
LKLGTTGGGYGDQVIKKAGPSRKGIREDDNLIIDGNHEILLADVLNSNYAASWS